MQQLPWIGMGHLAYVVAWAVLGMCVSAVAWANGRLPASKDYLAGTLGISFEALGVEIGDRHPSLVVPLAAGLLFALLIRYLPDTRRTLRIRSGRKRVRQMMSVLLVLAFFWAQVFVLLLAYRGWWDRLVLYPEV